MSYLNVLRLHFAGQFQANPSTVNNDPGHFNNAAFQPGWQEMEGNNMNPPNGWFNPQGDAAFRLFGCSVTAAWTAAGAVTGSDPVLGYVVADSDQQVCGKMVDLDPEQQLVSEIWGLQVRITDGTGNTLMSGTYEVAAFIDIWDRASSGNAGGDADAGAAYQSVLSNLHWGDVGNSPFLTALQTASAATGLLSIKFNVDGINLDFTSPDFMCGRIVGTIGPYVAGEPQHLVIGRQFMTNGIPPTPQNGINFFGPVGGINFFPAVIDAESSQILLDLGNAISTSTPGGPLNNLGDLSLGIYDPFTDPINPAGSIIPVGTIPATGSAGYFSDPQWYAQTAGIVVLPLDAQQFQLAGFRTLVLSGNEGIYIGEAPNAAFVRADTFVYRMSPGDTRQVALYAMQYGKPLAQVSLSFVLDPSQLQTNSAGFPYVSASPPAATPTGAVTFSPTATTDANGMALMSLVTTDPGTPRWFTNGTGPATYGIDGQVYGIRASFTDAEMDDGPVNPWNFMSLLLWSGYTASSSPTWTDVQPIFQQYANLYPVMLRFLNLADYDSIKAHAGLLTLAFGLDVTDPNSMPVTRDLSPAKRATILQWLANPQQGTSTTPAPATVAADGTAPVTTMSDETTAVAMAARKGGKAAAASRRLFLQNR